MRALVIEKRVQQNLRGLTTGGLPNNISGAGGAKPPGVICYTQQGTAKNSSKWAMCPLDTPHVLPEDTYPNRCRLGMCVFVPRAGIPTTRIGNIKAQVLLCRGQGARLMENEGINGRSFVQNWLL